MSRHLLATTALTVFLISGAHAEDITTKKTTPLSTSTVKAGGPDAISITKDGSVVLTGGTAVTIDSNNKVSNAGAITISNATGAVGIRALANTNADIVNSGTITIDESYTPTDVDKDGDLDGPFALGSNRFGIRVEGDHIGNIVNSGTITVKGNQSAGITVGGTLTGNFVHDGKTTILGDNSVAVDLEAVSGNVRLAGIVSAIGANSVAARFGGDIGGALVVQGDISSTGYRYKTAPSDASRLDNDDLLQGGSALVIAGDVEGGIVLAVAPKDADPNNADEDGDGIEDAKEGNAKVVTYGSAAAAQIGGQGHDIMIGSVAGTASGYGLQIDGTVEGHGVYAGVNGNGLQIGGTGGLVTIEKGIGIAGAIGATSKDSIATAVKLAAGTTTPEVRGTGKVAASTGDAVGAHATAFDIAAGASLPRFYNSGVISATSGAKGTTTAIVDHSGTLAFLENSGSISASGGKDAGSNVAIDVSANGNGVVVRQIKVGSGYAAPAIAGDVVFGAGDDQLTLEDGTLTGDVRFGGGDDKFSLSGDAVQKGRVTFGASNDAMQLADTAVFDGTADFGGGADVLTLMGTSKFTGSIVNAGGLAIDLQGGTLDLKTPSSFASLNVGATGVLVATLNHTPGAGSAYVVSGDATFVKGAKLVLRLADVEHAVGSYNVLTAGTITGLGDLETLTDLVPYMFKAALDTNAPTSTLAVDISRKTAGELDLNSSQSSAYDAVFNALSTDKDIGNVFLGITNGDAFKYTVGEMLPDHAGGSFEGISLGTRTTARQLLDPASPLVTKGKFSATANLAFWGSDKDTGETAAYNLHGYSWSVSGEYATGLGKFGATLAYLWNQHKNGIQSRVAADTFELAGHWRGTFGPLTGFARGSLGRANFDSVRTFSATVDNKPLERKIEGSWNGDFVTAMAGLSGEGGGAYFFFRPSVTIDYIRLKEDGYSETGGGKALDLIVEGRKSDELGLNSGLTLGYDFVGRRKRDENWFRFEVEGGWRQILSGDLGDTTAHFQGGTDLTLVADASTKGAYGRLRALGGVAGFTVGGELSGEDRHGSVDLALRGSVSVAF
ncbi:autotransporter outer membrane beta-barrel domain-containing protein [Sphingorhabdus soli]|uniref:Autotransporter outer membrane beta-barrel domain-containing protein n=1 Tax=Flavisphingopyxis soli TaxID=2601267 RepID=A0A5C6U8G2_9SPHN|nr:autotransporter outer membrane beta-barrel domain-containing protein [Sphingorhabdus soli]TXC69159.1 autotransporter outer membrane beta-barrel domain-containing protein [Sphingorhabdus soli]